MKKALLLLILALITTHLSATVEVDNIYYDINYERRTATVVGATGITAVNIPTEISVMNGNELQQYRVTAIDVDAFRSSSITSVTIPGSVTSIGSHAFWACRGLTTVTIPGSVTTIGNGAFEDCTGLVSIYIGGGISQIPNQFCSGCTSLSHVSLPTSVKTIGSSAFNRTALTSIDLPDGVTFIDSSAFRDCSNLQRANLGTSLKTIEEKAFCNCTALTNVNFGSNLETIGYMAFHNCTHLQLATLPMSVKTIGDAAFAQNDAITAFTFGENIKEVGDMAFGSCHNLTTVTMNCIGTTFRGSTFWLCEALTDVHIKSLENWCGYTFGGEQSNPMYYAQHLYLNGQEVVDLVIPPTVTDIKSGTFIYCNNIESVTFHPNVKTLGVNSFYYTYVSHIYCYAVEPPDLKPGAFNNEGGKYLHVPAASVDKYAAHNTWRYFRMSDPLEVVTGIGAITNDEALHNGDTTRHDDTATYDTATYDITGRKATSAARITITAGKKRLQ